MINIGNLLDACGISYTEKQLVKLDKLVNKLLKQLSLQQFVSNETTKHDSTPYSRTKDFPSKIEITRSQHSIQEFNIELEACYNNTIIDEIPKGNEIEIKEEFLKDPFASLETINNSKDISDVVHEEIVESNDSSLPIIEKTSNFKCKFCNEDFISKNKLNWHISKVHNSYPPIKEGIPEESENEIKDEFPKDPFASLEAFDKSEGVSDIVQENCNPNAEKSDRGASEDHSYAKSSLPVSSPKLINGTKLTLNDKGAILDDLTPKISRSEKAEVLLTTPSKTTNYTKKCSFCWVEVLRRGHFKHEEACAKKMKEAEQYLIYDGIIAPPSDTSSTENDEIINSNVSKIATISSQFGRGISKMVGPKKQAFWPRINKPPRKNL